MAQYGSESIATKATDKASIMLRVVVIRTAILVLSWFLLLMKHFKLQYLSLYSLEFKAVFPAIKENHSSRRLSSTKIVEQTNLTSFFPFIDSSTPHQCKKNAIVYLAQKKHSTYQRNSLELLERSLKLLHSNYLLLHDHHKNVNVFIFHEGDFDTSDIALLESSQQKGLVHLVNLTSTPFWQLPDHLRRDNPTTWKGAHEYQLGTVI